MPEIRGTIMQEEITTAVKIAPAAAGAVWTGLTLNEWVAVVTIIYVAAQAGLLVPKYWDLLKKRLMR